MRHKRAVIQVVEIRNPTAEIGLQAFRDYQRIRVTLADVPQQLSDLADVIPPPAGYHADVIAKCQRIIALMERLRYRVPNDVMLWEISPVAKNALLRARCLTLTAYLERMEKSKGLRYASNRHHREIPNYLYKHGILDSRQWLDYMAA